MILSFCHSTALAYRTLDKPWQVSVVYRFKIADSLLLIKAWLKCCSARGNRHTPFVVRSCVDDVAEMFHRRLHWERLNTVVGIPRALWAGLQLLPEPRQLWSQVVPHLDDVVLDGATIRLSSQTRLSAGSDCHRLITWNINNIYCYMINSSKFLHHFHVAFGAALTLLVGCQEDHPACKNVEWWGAGMAVCLERGVNDLHMVQLMPLPIISCVIKIQIV